MNKNPIKEVCVQTNIYKRTDHQLQTCSTCEYAKEKCK